MKTGQISEFTARSEDVPLRQLIAVAVDVGKSSAKLRSCDFTGRVLLPPYEFPLTRPGVAGVVTRLQAAVPADARLVRVGVEAAGHYHLPVIAPGGPAWARSGSAPTPSAATCGFAARPRPAW